MSANTTSFQFFINLIVTKSIVRAESVSQFGNMIFLILLLFFSQDRDINVIYVSGQDLKKFRYPVVIKLSWFSLQMAEEEKELSFEEQLKLEELERRKRDGTLTKKDPDGTVYEWDDDKKAWFPKVCTTMKNKEMFFS